MHAQRMATLDSFDLRRRLYKISKGNIDMVEAARDIGASAKFTASPSVISNSPTVFKFSPRSSMLVSSSIRSGPAVSCRRLTCASV